MTKLAPNNRHINRSNTASPRASRVNASGRLLKRAVDICVALSILGLFLPVALALSALIKCTHSRILRREQVAGRGGQTFNRLFWSVDTRNYPAGVTRILLVELSFLPSLLNVLSGDMAIVGPTARSARQHRALRHLAPDHEVLLQVKPGLIGVPLKPGRVDAGSQVRSEIEYINNWSLTADLRLISQRAIAYPLGTDSRA